MKDMRRFWSRIDRYFIGMVIGVALQIAAFFIIGNLSDDAFVVWCSLDDAIPFFAPFVIPYAMWFLYIAVGLISFWHFHLQSEADHREFIRILWIMGLGLIFCAVFYLIFPTTIKVSERPDLSDTHGLSNWLMNFIYGANVKNNALPSEHCYVSMVLCLGFLRAPVLKKSHHRYWVYPASITMSLLIFAATVFTKQHSILDFFAALLLFAVLYVVVYCIPWKRSTEHE